MFGIRASARRGRQAGVPNRSAGLRPTRRVVISCACGIALAVLTGCGSTTSPSGEAPSSSAPAAGSGTETASAAVITIKNFTFTTPDSVSPGAKITVDNKDGVAHTVTSDSGGAFDSPAPPGNSSFTAPTTPGSYPFHCNIHPEMHGTLVVQ